MKDLRKSGRKLLWVALYVLLIFAVLEVTTRIYITHLAGQRTFLKYASLGQLQKRPAYAKSKYAPHRYLGHYLTPDYVKGDNKHNSLGYRSDEIALPKPTGQFRIVCMGGSTTYTTEVEDYRLSYPSLLERELKSRGYGHVTVINAGVGAWTSWESLINFELRVLDLEPDMIIVYHGVNDILSRFVWPPEAYRGDNSGAIAPVKMSMPSIFEYSAFFRYWMIRSGLVKPHSSMDRQLAAPPGTYYAGEFYGQKVKHVYPDGVFARTSAKEMLAANRPKYFRRNIEHIVLIASHRGMKTILATFAHSPLFEDQPIVVSEEYTAAYAEMNDTLRSIALETGVHLFDFAAAFPVDKRYYTDGIHVNADGAELKASLFAEYIVDNALIPPSRVAHVEAPESK
ncbi:MAG: SGNH/GDSL hydrolase family protein [Phycisphaerales bacterium]|nr:MAG: SGNH/GDSL hydrolase family protein [Phycisphaerales bacterium]